MNKKEIIEIGKLIKHEHSKHLEFKKHNVLFNQEVNYQIFFEDYKSEGFELSDQIMSSIHAFLQFDQEQLNLITEACFKHFEMCIAVTDYGIDEEILEKYNDDFGKANKELFNIYTPEAAMEKAVLDCVDFLEQDNEGTMNIYLSLYFKVPWEHEHGMRMHFQNNKLTEVE